MQTPSAERVEKCQGRTGNSPKVRERAVRMVAEHRDEYPSEWAAFTST